MIGKSDRRMKYALMVPVVSFILIVAIFPLFFSLFMMLAQWQPGQGGLQFVGLKNFNYMVHDQRFWHALWLSFAYVAILIFFELTIGTLIALVLQRDVKGKNFFRVSYMLPMLLAPIAVSYIWKMIFDFNRGPANHWLTMLGLKPVEWLSGEFSAIISLIIVDVWQWTPFLTMIFLAALLSMPKEPLEAADVDGASWFQKLIHVTVPLIRNIMLIGVVLRGIDLFKTFDIIYSLTGGGPGRLTETLNIYTYNMIFQNLEVGYAAALSIFALVIASIVLMRVAKSTKLGG